MKMPNYLDIEGKLAVVSGGSGAIGRAGAKALLQCGAKVVLFNRNEEKLKEAQAELSEYGETMILAGDVDDAGDITRIVEFAGEQGGVDILVNSVGTQRRKPLLEATVEDLDYVWSVNTRGVFAMTQAFLPQMVEKNYGKIINLCSIGSFVGLDVKTIYAITKGALLQYTRSSAVELAKYGIRVNCIAPGYVETPMTADWIHHPDREPGYLARIPMGRYAFPEDIEGTFAYLAGPGSDYVTGQMIVLDGGWTLW